VTIVLGQPIIPVFRSHEMGLIGCPEESFPLKVGPVICPIMSQVKNLFPWIWDQ